LACRSSSGPTGWALAANSKYEASADGAFHLRGTGVLAGVFGAACVVVVVATVTPALADPAQPPWHFTTWLDLLDHWQTIIAGGLALAAGIITVVATMIIARKQINASREDADRAVAAAREQSRAIFKQTETTFDLAQMRDASKASAFHVMLAAAMDRVLAEAAWGRRTYPQLMTPQKVLEAMGAGLEAGWSPDAFAARQCITKGAFPELRSACVRRGWDLTSEFLDLEREIDSFALQYEDRAMRVGKHAGLDEQLALIETKAAALREKAVERFSGSLPAPPRRNGGAV
jgi:hypothetical protein